MNSAGFTYRGEHSSRYGVSVIEGSRVVAPPRNTADIQIPGRSGVHDQELGTWGIRTESFQCGWRPLPGTRVSVSEQIRDIAGWLGYPGALRFDSEPDKYYNARIISAPTVDTRFAFGRFSVTFEANPPFAFGATVSQTFTVPEGTPVQLAVEGTVKTPVRIILRNDGGHVIHNLTLRRRKI